jgi:hypothetical protein
MAAQGPRPLIVVCASGGGIRAAAWTAAVLERLDAHPAFRRSVRLVTGASGGMVGGAFWVARLHGEGRSQGVFEAVSRDALSPLAHRLIARDIPSAFLPIVNRENRGEALERAWSDASNGEMDAMLGELYQREQRGELPSLVFTPVIVEDGRRWSSATSTSRTSRPVACTTSTARDSTARRSPPFTPNRSCPACWDAFRCGPRRAWRRRSRM